MGKYAGSVRTRALSGAETIHANGDVLEYLIQGNQHCYCAVHTPQCRTYGTMPYEICRTGARILSFVKDSVFVLFTDKAESAKRESSAEGARNERFSASKVCRRQTESLSFRGLLASPLVTHILKSSSTHILFCLQAV